jgi:hypothetical protein
MNPNTEMISGTALPNSDLGLYIRHRVHSSWAWMDLTSDSEGNWQAELLYILDIEPGSYCHLVQYDEEGNRSVIYSHVPDPYIIVDPQNNTVAGSFWPLETEVQLSIAASQWTSISNARGEVTFDISRFDILSSQVITIAGGGYTRTYIVRNLSITGVDQENDIVFGTADPGSQILVRLYYENGEGQESGAASRSETVFDETIEITTDDLGNWQADFSGNADIGNNFLVQATLVESGNNQTQVNWDRMNDYRLYIPVLLQ